MPQENVVRWVPEVLEDYVGAEGQMASLGLKGIQANRGRLDLREKWVCRDQKARED